MIGGDRLKFPSSWLSLPSSLSPPLFVCFLYVCLTLEVFFICLIILSWLRMKVKMPIGSWLRHIDFELGYTEVWGYWLLGNLFGGLCSWAGWISRMYFSVLYPRGSGSGCWISEWEEWVSLQSAFMVDIIVWPSSLPPCFLYGTHTLKYADMINL